MLEKRIFENRQKIVSLQRVLQPYHGYKPAVEVVPSVQNVAQVLQTAKERVIPTKGLTKQKVEEMLGPYENALLESELKTEPRNQNTERRPAQSHPSPSKQQNVSEQSPNKRGKNSDFYF